MKRDTVDTPPTALSRVDYRDALQRQHELVEARRRGDVPDLVWYLEHEPVVTWNPGRGGRHIVAPRERFEASGVALEETTRGGDVTYHGPGQLVAYPIVELGSDGPVGRDLHRYLRALEDAIIATIARWGITGERLEGLTGIWVAGEKIAAIGVRASRWIVSHGLAINVRCNLGPFRDLIVPCGIADRGVTSMERLLSAPPTCAELVPPLHRALEEALGRPLAATFDGRAAQPEQGGESKRSLDIEWPKL